MSTFKCFNNQKYSVILEKTTKHEAVGIQAENRRGKINPYWNPYTVITPKVTM